jgi:hypothetical protein
LLNQTGYGAGVRVRRCTNAWWMETLRGSRFQQRRQKGGIYAETMESRRENLSWI